MRTPCARHPYTTGGRLGAPAAGAGGAGYMLAWERAPSGMCRTLSGHVRPGASVGYAPASRVVYVPDAQGGLPHVLYVPGSRTSLGRTVRAHRVPW